MTKSGFNHGMRVTNSRDLGYGKRFMDIQESGVRGASMQVRENRDADYGFEGFHGEGAAGRSHAGKVGVAVFMLLFACRRNRNFVCLGFQDTRSGMRGASMQVRENRDAGYGFEGFHDESLAPVLACSCNQGVGVELADLVYSRTFYYDQPQDK